MTAEHRKIKMVFFWMVVMLIQGERVQYLPIEEVVDNIFGDSEHAKRKQSIANAALGVVRSASLIVHRIGRGLSEAKKLLGKHAVKQVDRLLSNDKLNVSDAFARTVISLVLEKKLLWRWTGLISMQINSRLSK